MTQVKERGGGVTISQVKKIFWEKEFFWSAQITFVVAIICLLVYVVKLIIFLQFIDLTSCDW